MAKRSISDTEISLIKAMLRRGMKNKDIQFFFNRPDRSVNSGRITGIWNGTYSNSAQIAPSTDDTLDAYLAGFKPTEVAALVTVPSAEVGHMPVDPLDPKTLMRMFRKGRSGVWGFILGESDQHECKESFGFKYPDKWLRPIAALANRNGGYLLFGVKDRSLSNCKLDRNSYRVVGLQTPEFEDKDVAEFSKRIRATFDPTPRIERTVLSLDGLKVGVLYVHPHASRPVIATKNEGSDIKEGDIFFRYSGQTTRIKYSDLRAILDERDREAREQILPMIERLLRLGPQDAMVADLANGVLSGDGRSILIGKDLIDKIKFIPGQFSEAKGKPTLKLVGDVQTVDTAEATVRHEFVTPRDIIQDFLNEETPHDPTEYIRCAIEAGNGAWFPMHYYAKQAGFNREQLANFIMETTTPSKRKETYRDRATGKKSAFQRANGQAALMISEFTEGKLPQVNEAEDAAAFGRAIAGLEVKPEVPIRDILSLFRRCIDIVQTDHGDRFQPGHRDRLISFIRRGAARLDELYFADSSN